MIYCVLFQRTRLCQDKPSSFFLFQNFLWAWIFGRCMSKITCITIFSHRSVFYLRKITNTKVLKHVRYTCSITATIRAMCGKDLVSRLRQRQPDIEITFHVILASLLYSQEWACFYVSFPLLRPLKFLLHILERKKKKKGKKISPNWVFSFK